MKTLKTTFTFLILTLIYITSSLSLISCSKDNEPSTEIIGPANFSDIKFSDIQAKENAMTTADINAVNSNEIIWKPETIILFKTNSGRFGKFSVNEINPDDFSLSINVILFNLDGSEKENSNIVIGGGISCDIDTRILGTINRDFLWNVTTTRAFLIPKNDAKFVQL